MIAGRITTFIRSAFAGMSDSPAAGLFRPSWLLSHAARKTIDYTLESKAAADGYQFIFALCPASLTQRLPSVPSSLTAVADLCRTDILTLGSISPLMTKWSRNREVEFGSCGRCRPAGGPTQRRKFDWLESLDDHYPGPRCRRPQWRVAQSLERAETRARWKPARNWLSGFRP